MEESVSPICCISYCRQSPRSNTPPTQIDFRASLNLVVMSSDPVKDGGKSFTEEKGAYITAGIPNIEDGTTGTAIDPEKERTLVWKFDLRILPVLAVMYLFNSLDKSNLGNAKTAGLETDLNLQGQDYSTILSIFFVPYVLTAPFLGILGKKYGPNRVLPCMMFVFGTCTICVVAVHNFAGLMAVRWFLGMSESAFFPLVIYYQTTSVLSS